MSFDLIPMRRRYSFVVTVEERKGRGELFHCS